MDCLNRMLHAQRNEANSKLVITSFLGRIVANKNSRRLQSISISHCILHRLKNAFCILKLLLTPRKKQTVQEWYRSRVLSYVFGSWFSFTQSEQAAATQLSAKSKYFHDKKLLLKYIAKNQLRRIASFSSTRNMHLAITYFSSLRFLESFENFQDRINKKCFLRMKYNSAKKFGGARMKSHCIGKKRYEKRRDDNRRLMITSSSYSYSHSHSYSYFHPYSYFYSYSYSHSYSHSYSYSYSYSYSI